MTENQWPKWPEPWKRPADPWPTYRLQRNAAAERAALDGALAAAAPGTVPCTVPGQSGKWTAEDDLQTAAAALMCPACPCLRPCRAYRKRARPTAGVWAGQVTQPTERLPSHD